MTPEQLESLLKRTPHVIHVVLSDVRGSSPRETGAEMFVTDHDALGTIGGGRLEHLATEAARDLLLTGEVTAHLDVPLGPEIGQCCGGHVTVSLSRMSDSDRDNVVRRIKSMSHARPHVYIMGSGHVGRALANQLQHLPFQTIIVDQRANELVLCDATVEKRLSAIPEFAIRTAPADSAFVILTHDHALDFLLTAAALDRNDAAYVGLIGSATKRARFEKFHRESGTVVHHDRLTCPIGKTDTRDKRSEVIASFVVAEVITALSQCNSKEFLHSDPVRILQQSAKATARASTGTPQ